jgi:toxin ParE1/3/4
MIAVIVSPQAKTDIESIVDYLAGVASPTTARRWNGRLWDAISHLGDFPGSGSPRPALGDHIRIAIIAPYILIYEHERGSEQLAILRVIHGRRHITGRLLAGLA